jgi:hypothetical protein
MNETFLSGIVPYFRQASGIMIRALGQRWYPLLLGVVLSQALACSGSETNSDRDAVTAGPGGEATNEPGSPTALAPNATSSNSATPANPPADSVPSPDVAPSPAVEPPGVPNDPTPSAPPAPGSGVPSAVTAIAPNPMPSSEASAPAPAPAPTESAQPGEPDAPVEPATEPVDSGTVDPVDPEPVDPEPVDPEPVDPGSVFPPEVTTPKIMIVGDSISAGPGCYKKYLDQQLQTNEITNYEFVGEYDDDCGAGVRHSAVSCTTSGQYTQPTFTVGNCFAGQTFPGMATLVATHSPDLIMIQLGVNDVWGGTAPIDPILDNYETLIEQARAHNANVVVVVAQIHKIITDSCTNDASTAKAEELINALKDILR